MEIRYSLPVVFLSSLFSISFSGDYTPDTYVRNDKPEAENPGSGLIVHMPPILVLKTFLLFWSCGHQRHFKTSSTGDENGMRPSLVMASEHA